MSGLCASCIPFPYCLYFSTSLFSLCFSSFSLSLSKNALSFFIRDLIFQASSSTVSSLAPFPSASFSSGSSCLPSSSSFRAHSVRGVAVLVAFAQIAPLSSILEAATWSSSSVFTYFYLKDVQFLSPLGFSLGPLVVAGSVV